MENEAMYIPLWIKIIVTVCCIGMIVLLAMWSIILEWIRERSKALPKKMLSVATICSNRFVLEVAKNATKLGHYMNRHLHIRPRHA